MIPYAVRALTAGAFTLALSIPVGAAHAAQTAPAGGPTPVGPAHAQTLANLTTSMRTEAFASIALSLFSAEAQRERMPAVARLFREASSFVFNQQFMPETVLARLVGNDAANLRSAISGEDYESRVMYPTFARQARQDGDLEAARLFTDLAADEGRHRDAYRAALNVLTTGKGTIPKPPLTAKPTAVRAGAAKVRSQRTKANLRTAMLGEAFAYARYTLFAKRAQASGNKAVATLFSAAADVEHLEHFAGEARLAGLVGNTHANVNSIITGGRQEARMESMFAKRAKALGDLAAANLFQKNATHLTANLRRFEAALRTLAPAARRSAPTAHRSDPAARRSDPPTR